MRPTGQCLHAITPSADVLELRADIKAELFRRIIEVSGEGDVGDGRLIAQEERYLGQPLIDDSEVAVDAPLQKSQYGRIAGRAREDFQKPVRSQKAIHLLIVENDPAQRLKAGIFAVRLETTGAVSEVGEDHTGLAQ